ncbi:MAG: sigma-70 family RNA polymerase sigma factor, partial [Myxococcota bacterium]
SHRRGGLVSGPFWRPVSAEEVTLEYGDAVYRQLKRIFGPRTDVDDLFQNVFVEVLRSLPSWSGRARLGAWIRRVTANVAYQEMRLSYRRPAELTYDDELDGSELHDPERAAQIGELYRALAKLEPKLRIVVVLYDLEGQTMKEIGLALGRPLPTIQSQLKAARTRLGVLMTESNETSEASDRERGRK